MGVRNRERWKEEIQKKKRDTARDRERDRERERELSEIEIMQDLYKEI